MHIMTAKTDKEYRKAFCDGLRKVFFKNPETDEQATERMIKYYQDRVNELQYIIKRKKSLVNPDPNFISCSKYANRDRYLYNHDLPEWEKKLINAKKSLIFEQNKKNNIFQKWDDIEID